MILSKKSKLLVLMVLILNLSAQNAQAGNVFEDIANLVTLGQYDREKKENEARLRREEAERARQERIRSYRDQIAAKRHSRSILQDEIRFINSQLTSKEAMREKMEQLFVFMDEIYQQSIASENSSGEVSLDQQTYNEVTQNLLKIIRALSQEDKNQIEISFLEEAVQSLSQNIKENSDLVIAYFSQLNTETLVVMMSNLEFMEAVSHQETNELKRRRTLKVSEMETLVENISNLERTLNNLLNPPKPKPVQHHTPDRPVCHGSRCTLVP